MLHVQDAISVQIERKLGLAEVTAYQTKQADAVLKPIKKFLDKHGVNYRCTWVAGAAASQIIDTSNAQERVVDWFPGDGLFTPLERRHGLPIGNLTSQLFANVVLDQLDHFALARARPVTLPLLRLMLAEENARTA